MTPPSTYQPDQSLSSEKQAPSSSSAAPTYQPYLPPLSTPDQSTSYPSPYPTPAPSTSGSMATTAGPLPSTDILPRLPGHNMSGMYQSPSTGRSDKQMEYDPRPYPTEQRRESSGRPKENVRYDPYGSDRRKASGRDRERDEKIVLPPPSMSGLRIPDDPNAPKHVLPSINYNQPSWSEGSGRIPSPLPPVQLPSLRSLSGETSPATNTSTRSAPPPPPPTRGYDRPMESPRVDPYRAALSPAMSRPQSQSQYPQPIHPFQYQSRAYGQTTGSSHSSYPQYQPNPPPLPQSRKTHPPPHGSRDDPPVRIKYEPEHSPPLRQNQIPRGGDMPFYPNPSPPRYSPTGPISGYNDARRGSVASMSGEGKEQIAGQTRRLAHLMSEQKRRESINTGFGALRAALPLALPTDSKAIILRKALARIEQLERAAGIVPPSSSSHQYHHMPSEGSAPPTARSDWRNNGSLHPRRSDDRLPSANSHSSGSSRQPREEQRYDDWQGGNRGYEQGMEMDVGGYAQHPQLQPPGQSGNNGGGEDGQRRWAGEDEDEDAEGDEGSVYSQDKPPSRESHVR